MGKNEKYYDSLIDNMQYVITSWKGANICLSLPRFDTRFCFNVFVHYIVKLCRFIPHKTMV